jgi:plastocyanin
MQNHLTRPWHLALLATLALALVAAGSAGSATSQAQATKTVQIARTAFTPYRTIVQVGDTVTWHNADTRDHQVVADNGSFASPVLKTDQTYSFTFQAAGEYYYHDGLYPAHKGRITVQGPTPTVSAALSAPLVKYGQPVTLTGKISQAVAGQSVAIMQTNCGQQATQVATVQTAADGSFTYTATPASLTSFSVQWKNAKSQPVSVQVAPTLRFLPFTQTYKQFYTKVTTGDEGAFAGKYVYLQTLSAYGDWVSVAKYNLGPLSGRIFPRPSLKGLHVYRIALDQTNAGQCFAAAQSGTQKIRNR